MKECHYLTTRWSVNRYYRCFTSCLVACTSFWRDGDDFAVIISVLWELKLQHIYFCPHINILSLYFFRLVRQCVLRTRTTFCIKNNLFDNIACWLSGQLRENICFGNQWRSRLMCPKMLYSFRVCWLSGMASVFFCYYLLANGQWWNGQDTKNQHGYHDHCYYHHHFIFTLFALHFYKLAHAHSTHEFI